MNSKRENHEIEGLKNCFVDGFKLSITPLSTYKSLDSSDTVVRYFLTHYHSDHYGGLSKSWSRGIIICSSVTALILINVMGIDKCKVTGVNIGESIVIPGAKVTFLDANHCPGAAMLLFELENGTCHLHTGDIRYCPQMKEEEILKRLKIDRLYLDTTYANPKYKFISQSESLQIILESAQKFFSKFPNNGIIYIGTYTFGKERIIFNLANAFPERKFYMEERRIQLMNQLDEGRKYVQQGNFTSKPLEASFHIVSMGFAGSLWPFLKPNFQNIRNHLEESNAMRLKSIQPPISIMIEGALAFIPSGWADSSNWSKLHSIVTDDQLTVQSVPYSEHSSYDELIEFVSFIKPAHIIPTVYSDEKNRMFILDLFRNCVDRTASIRSFVAKLTTSIQSWSNPFIRSQSTPNPLPSSDHRSISFDIQDDLKVSFSSLESKKKARSDLDLSNDPPLDGKKKKKKATDSHHGSLPLITKYFQRYDDKESQSTPSKDDWQKTEDIEDDDIVEVRVGADQGKCIERTEKHHDIIELLSDSD